MKYRYTFFIAWFLLAPIVVEASITRDFKSLIASQNLQYNQQAMCVKDAAGKTLSFNADMRVVPASVTKLYVFDLALSTLPSDFRYQTTFIQNGQVLYINGGGDPHLTIEHLRSALNEMYTSTQTKVSTFVISPDVYFNWASTPKEVQINLFRSLKAEKNLPITPRIKVVVSSRPYTGAGAVYQFYSAPLRSLLKQINSYSTNLSAEVLFQRSGGIVAMKKHLKNVYGVDEETALFTTGSGLSGNYTTCALTLRVLERLDEQFSTLGISAAQILSVPTVDQGTLKTRAIDPQNARAVVAKSGFINQHHTLAGIINTKKGSTYFGIFTTYKEKEESAKTKSMIDDFLNTLLAQYRRSLVPFVYEPQSITPQGYFIARK